VGTVAFGALSGGIGAELSGGNFWQGAVTGGIVAGLNHSLHKMDPPTGFKGKVWIDETGTYVRNPNGTYTVTRPDGSIGIYTELEVIVLINNKSLSTLSNKVNQSAEAVGNVAGFQEGLLKGSQGITVAKYTKALSGIGKGVTFAQAGVGTYNTYEAYSKTGSFNYSAQRTAAGTIGAIVGGYIGTNIGASAGFVLGGPVVAGFGAVIGAGFYGFIGQKLGEGVVDIYHNIK